MQNKHDTLQKMIHWPDRFLLAVRGVGPIKKINHVCACLLISIDQPFTLTTENACITSHAALIPQGETPSVNLGEGRHILWGLDGLHQHQALLRKSYHYHQVGGVFYNFEPENIFINHARCCVENENIGWINLFYQQLINPLRLAEAIGCWDKRIVNYLYHSVTNNFQAPDTLAYAAERSRMSESNFRQLFKRSFGVPFSRYCIYRKLKLFCKIYAETSSLSDSASGSSFVDLPHAIKSFKKIFGVSPGSLFQSEDFRMIFTNKMECNLVTGHVEAGL